MSSTGEQLLQLREELKREAMGRQRQEEVNSKLQDEYHILLKRLAEAELHIDRLRLGAHVEINRRVVTTNGTEQRTRLGQMPGAQFEPSLRLHPNASSKQQDSDNPYRYRHGDKSTVENTGVNTDTVESGWSEPYASSGASPAGSQLNGSAESQTSLTHSATATDISLMSVPSIANRASAESMQVAHLFRIRGLREQLSSLSDSITAGRASVEEVMTALGAIQGEHRQLAEEITTADGGQGGSRSQEAIESELASLAEQLRELEELLQSKAQDLLHFPPPTLTSSPQHNGQGHAVVPSISPTESTMGTSGRSDLEPAEGSATEDGLSNDSLESPSPANYFADSTQDAGVHAPPLTPPSFPQGTPSHLHSGTLTDREDPSDSDHTHSQVSRSSTHGSPRDSLGVSEFSHSTSREPPLATRTSTQEDESDTHALREGGLPSGRGRALTLGVGLESQDDGTLSDLSHSCSFPSDGLRVMDPATTGHQRLEPEVLAAQVHLASTLPPSLHGYHSRIPRPLPGHTPSKLHPSHTDSTQAHVNSSPLPSSRQSPVVSYDHQRLPSDWTMPGEMDSGFAGSEWHSGMMGGVTRTPTATGVYQSEHRRDGERKPSLTAAAIDALRAELADLKQQVLNTSQQPGSTPSSPSISSSSVHSQDPEVPIPRPPTSHHSPPTSHSAQPHSDRHSRPNVTRQYTVGSQIEKPMIGKSVSTQASPASRSKASQSRPSLGSTSTQTRGDRWLPPQPSSPLVHTQSRHLANSHPSTPVRRASLLTSSLATPLHAATYPTTPTEQTPLHSVQFSTPQPPSSYTPQPPSSSTTPQPPSSYTPQPPSSYTPQPPSSSAHHHTTPHHHAAAAPSRTPTVDCSCGHESTLRSDHVPVTTLAYGNTPPVVHDHQGGWICLRCGTCGSDDTATAANAHGRLLTNGQVTAASGFPAHSDRGWGPRSHRRELTRRRSMGARVSEDYYPPRRAEEHRQQGDPSEVATSATRRRSGFGPPPKYVGPHRHVHASVQYSGTESSGSDSEFRPEAEQRPNKYHQPRRSSSFTNGRGLQTRLRNRGLEHSPVHPVATSTPTNPHRRAGWEREEKWRPVRTVPQSTHDLRRDLGMATARSTKTHRAEKPGHTYAYTHKGPPHLYVHQDGYGAATSSSDECFQEAVYPAESSPEFYILKRAKPQKKSQHYAYVHKPTLRGKPSYIRVSSPRTEEVYFSDPTLSPGRRRGMVVRPRSTEEACPEDSRAEDGSSGSEVEVEVTPDLGEVCQLARQLSWRSNRIQGRLDSEFSRHSSGLY